MVLKNCGYIDDEAIKLLWYRRDTLKYLEIENCKNLTDEGLRSLKDFDLKTLIVRNVPYVKNVEAITQELKDNMKNCNVDIKN